MIHDGVGRSSADERQLAFEDLEVAMAEAEAAKTSASSRARPAAAAKRNLGRLPKELPRSEVVIEPDSTLCPCGCGEMAKIGEDVSERLDVIPAQFRVLVTRRPRYGCRSCESAVLQAPAPARIVEGGIDIARQGIEVAPEHLDEQQFAEPREDDFAAGALGPGQVSGRGQDVGQRGRRGEHGGGVDGGRRVRQGGGGQRLGRGDVHVRGDGGGTECRPEQGERREAGDQCGSGPQPVGFRLRNQVIHHHEHVLGIAGHLPRVRGDVSFEKVHFRYEQSGRPLLDGIDLQVAAGETVAIEVAREGGDRRTFRVELVPEGGVQTVRYEGVPLVVELR